MNGEPRLNTLANGRCEGEDKDRVVASCRDVASKILRYATNLEHETELDGGADQIVVLCTVPKWQGVDERCDFQSQNLLHAQHHHVIMAVSKMLLHLPEPVLKDVLIEVVNTISSGEYEAIQYNDKTGGDHE